MVNIFGNGQVLTKTILNQIINKIQHNVILSYNQNLQLDKYSGKIIITNIKECDISNIIKKLSQINVTNKSNKYILCINEDIEKNNEYNLEQIIKINLNTVSRYTNHLITADFEEFDFSQLYDENQKDEQGILWDNSKVEYDKTNNKVISISQHHRFNVGDNVYVFYTNLPDGSKKILLKCLVTNNGYYNKNYKMEKCYYEGWRDSTTYINKEDKLPAIRLVIDKSINYEKDKNAFSEENLKGKYNLKNIQGKQYLSYDNNKKLLEDLDKCSDKLRDVLKKYKEYFFHKCELEEFKEIKSKHEMFMRKTGVMYFEGHHLIPESIGEKYQSLINNGKCKIKLMK